MKQNEKDLIISNAFNMQSKLTKLIQNGNNSELLVDIKTKLDNIKHHYTVHKNNINEVNDITIKIQNMLNKIAESESKIIIETLKML
jgi:hypothetical protein